MTQKRFFLLLGLMLLFIKQISAQQDTLIPIPIYEPITDEEAPIFESRYGQYKYVKPKPSVNGRYWTHKHEKYFSDFNEIKADSGNVLALYLSCSGGWQIPPEIERFVNLKRLEIYYSDDLLTLPDNVWRLDKLESLIIQSYDTTLVLSDSVGDLKSLKRLEIRGKLDHIPSSIGHLENLEELYMYASSFLKIPDEIGDLHKLKTLVIRSMELPVIPATIGKLTELRKLQIESHITALPVEIGNLTQLEVMELWNTNLETIPPEIGQLAHLQKLDIRSDRLTMLPKEFGKLTELKEFKLEGSQLTTLPDEICELTNLTDLNLYSNQLTSLPKHIGKMTSLRELDVQENQLNTLPASIGNLKNLVELDALSNPFTSLPGEITRLNPNASLNIERKDLIRLPDSVWRFINRNGCYISKVPTSIAGNKLSYYLNQPSIDPIAKLFVSGKFSLMYDMMSYDFLKMLDTIPDNNKAFYVFVINAIVESKSIDRGEYTYNYFPYDEIRMVCSALIVERPCTFFKDIKYGAYKESYDRWIEIIGSLYGQYEYYETMESISAKLKTCGSSYLKEVEEVLGPLFYSEK